MMVQSMVLNMNEFSFVIRNLDWKPAASGQTM